MKNFWLMIGCLLFLASASLAKDKLTSQWNCPKTTDAHSIDVGDEANHTYSISKTTCTESKNGMNSLKEKEGVGTQFNDTKGDTTTWHGVFVVTTEGGDKISYNYSSTGKGMLKDGQLQSGANKWSMTGGTGKFAGATGDGGCTGKGNADGSVTWDCSGNYTLK